MRAATGSGRSGWAALLRAWLRPLALALCLSLLLIKIDPSEMTDLGISDRMLVRQGHGADPALLIVEMTPEDARIYNGPPFNRSVLASLLGNLADGGARRVMLDIYLGSALVPQDDARLAAAMARLGPDRLGLVSSIRPSERPHPQFAQHATTLDARLTPDVDGRHRRIGKLDQVRGDNAARWLGTGIASEQPVPLDLRIRPTRFARVSMDDVIAGRANVAGRLVVVSMSSAISPSRAFMPSLPRADRGAVFAVGAQSAKDGFGKNQRQVAALEAALVALAMIFGVTCAVAASNWQRMLVYSALALTTLSAASLSLGYYLASQVQPSHLISSFMVFANLSLLHRLKILPMMASFLRGDVSPDEAWAWRTIETSQHPALLFGFNGQVKRSNPAGAELVAGAGEGLAAQCLPRPGERAREIRVSDAAGNERSFELDWPLPELPVVLLRDVSDADAVEQNLLRQLQTDDLTGIGNRRAFDQALDRTARSGEAYAVFYLDLNGFKAVNDTHGHDAGDELLVIVSSRLANLVRAGNTVARLGGDEFGIVAPGMASEAEAIHLRDRIVATVAKPITLSCIDAEVTVGVAVGHALSVGTGLGPDELLRAADQTMYRDKAQGKLPRAA